MAVLSLIASLKKTTRILKSTNSSILRHERKANPVNDPGLVIVPPLFHTRAEFDGVIADVTIAFILVNKYRAIKQGVPLDWDEALVDRYTGMEDSEAVVAEFMANIAGGTGLEWYLRGRDSDGEGEEVMDEEIFETYRATGCQRFSEFEIGVHRAVRRAADKALDLAVKVEAAGVKKKRKRSSEEEVEVVEKKVKVEE